MMAERTITHLERIVEGNNKLVGRSGKIYYIEELISGKRWMEFNIAQMELATGMSVPALFKEISRLFGLTNNTQTKKSKNGDLTYINNNGDIAVGLHNVLAGIQKINMRKSDVFKICSLYINEENEDRGVYNEDMMNAKMDDLITIYPYIDFFTLATAGLKKLISDLEELSRLGLQIPTVDTE